MKISAVNYVQTSVYSDGLKNTGKRPFSRICFRGQDFLDLPKNEVFKRIESSLVPENFIGQGTEAEVYRIKDTDYCVRIPHMTRDMYQQDFSKELTPTDKINHKVAKLGFGASVLKFFDGVTPKWYMNNTCCRHDLQREIANMPVQSYTELLHQIANGIDNEMAFDFSGGNLIVNTKGKKLTAIDFFRITEDTRQIKPLTEMYSVLTSYGAEEQTGKKIFDNIASAAFEEFKPNKIPCMDVALFDFIELCLKRMGEAHTPSGEKIKESVVFNADSLKMLKKKEIIDKMLSPFLEQQILVLKKLIGKVK